MAIRVYKVAIGRVCDAPNQRLPKAETPASYCKEAGVLCHTFREWTPITWRGRSACLPTRPLCGGYDSCRECRWSSPQAQQRRPYLASGLQTHATGKKFRATKLKVLTKRSWQCVFFKSYLNYKSNIANVEASFQHKESRSVTQYRGCL